MHESGLHYFDPRLTASTSYKLMISAGTDAAIAAVTDAELAGVAYNATITGATGAPHQITGVGGVNSRIPGVPKATKETTTTNERAAGDGIIISTTERDYRGATTVGPKAANHNGSDSADNWIEVRSKRDLRAQRLLNAHPSDGAPYTANFPPATPNATRGFYTAKTKRIFHHRPNAGLVLTVSDKHHRSVLGAIAPRIRNEHTEVVKRTGVVNRPTVPRGRLTKLKRNNRTRQPISTFVLA
jgi:hypothetical protein